MSEETVLKVTITDEIATVTLTRPQVRNALNEQMIVLLTQTFQKLSVATAVRAIVLKGEGKVFCAGADLGWLSSITSTSLDDRQRHAMQFAQMFDAIDRCAKPVLAVVHGPTNGAGVGIVAAAHIAIASETTSFTLPEAQRGLSSAVMIPYLSEALGPRALRRYLTTGEPFTAYQALHQGLLHSVAPLPKEDEPQVDTLGLLEQKILSAILKGAPETIANAMDTIRVCLNTPDDPDRMRWASLRFAEVLGSPEALEGIASFKEKRQPKWAR
jgi:methylglutaconyl-CoA hydratase